MASYCIRDGTEEDLPELHRLMQEIADNEDSEKCAPPPIETLKEYGFGEHRYFYFIVVEDTSDKDGPLHLTGFLLYSHAFSTETGPILNLRYVYITPSYRKKGSAKEMWKYFLKLAIKGNFGRVQWIAKGSDSLVLRYSQNYGLSNIIKREGWYLFNMSKSKITAMK
ncbi:spermidine/spermine N(1)-acetyltransferase-like protein 1 [Octopus bimaculoides]|uniref:spermidine/spermine N(1)-acetyltransferase-like protein 1 n=1 Tax=Octopus bimaculoides TaxID=37653 RepID=UPI0022DF9E6D|nr:spermidine/spermine N(1)-acetyltransferase-like protein 1 [Octopus bimaculoides]